MNYDPDSAIRTFRAELRSAIRDGRLGGRELPRSINEVVHDLREAEWAYMRALNLEREFSERVCSPIDAGRAQEAFASPDYVETVRTWELTRDAANEARAKLDALERAAMAMLQPDVIAQP